VSIDSYLRAAAKAELHLHLEGSVRPLTVFELARKNGMALPHDTIEDLGEWFRPRDFSHLMEVYRAICACPLTADDFERIAYELAAELARQNCRYAEVGFTPALHGRRGVSQATYLDGLSRARERARALGVEIAPGSSTSAAPCAAVPPRRCTGQITRSAWRSTPWQAA
jgi:adenosine deaminase